MQCIQGFQIINCSKSNLIRYRSFPLFLPDLAETALKKGLTSGTISGLSLQTEWDLDVF